MRIAATITIALALNLVGSPAEAVDWIFAPSTFTHDPASGQRIDQYAEAAPAYKIESPNYRRSGFRYNTSVNRVGPSADRIHIVEEWGRPVRPYGEWRFPFRPYSVPYDAWGPPFGGLEIYRPGFGFPGFPGVGPWPRPWLGPYDHPPAGAGPHRAAPQRPHQRRPGQQRPEPRYYDDRAQAGGDRRRPPGYPGADASPRSNLPPTAQRLLRSEAEVDRTTDGAFGPIYQGAT